MASSPPAADSDNDARPLISPPSSPTRRSPGRRSPTRSLSSPSRSAPAHRIPIPFYCHIQNFIQHIRTHPYSPRTFQTLCICIVFFIVVWGIRLEWKRGAMPKRVIGADEVGQFSAEAAWTVLKEIGKEPRSINDESNEHVRKYLISELDRLKSEASSLGRSDEYITILRDDATNLLYKNAYYESTNIVVRVQGSSSTDRSALLVSAHYDSTPLSHGVTDDGIAVAVMIELVRALIHNPVLKHDVILLFNNGEELGLFGGYSFLQHPWFTDVKAFINLEGTGTASGSRALLFRTNSYEMVEAYANSAPYPHASVLVDDMMAFVRSDTDYRPYAAYGKRPGLDIAFYTHRYLYHSLGDDLTHANALSVQQLGDNVVAVVKLVCSSDLLDSIQPGAVVEDPSGVLPSGGFVYYDFLGTQMVLASGVLQKTGMALLLVAVFIGTIFKAVAEARRVGVKRVIVRYGRPIFEAFVLVLATFALSIFVVFLLSTIKSLVNRGSTYGHPRTNLMWICMAIFATLCGIQIVWPWVAIKTRLRRKPVVLYSMLPTSIGEGDESHREETDGEMELDDSDVASLDSDDEDAPISPLRPTHHSSRHREILPSGPSLHIWQPYGILLFHQVLLFTALLLAATRNLMGFYIFYGFAFYSSLAVLVTISLGTIIRKWWRADVVVSNQTVVPTTTSSGFAKWKRVAVELYERYVWVLWMCIAGVIPLMHVMEVISIGIVGLPALIAEGLPETIVDLFFGFWTTLTALLFLPAVTRHRIHLPFLTAVFAILFVLSYVPSLWMFPFSPERPHKLTFTETWDIANRTSTVEVLVLPTMGAIKWGQTAYRSEEVDFDCEGGFSGVVEGVCRLYDFEPPQVGGGMMIKIDREDVKEGLVEGSVTGLESSKICLLGVEPYLPANPKESMDIGVQLEIHNLTRWTNFTAPQPGPEPPTVSHAIYYARSARIETTFRVTFPPNTSRPEITFICFSPARRTSQAYKHLLMLDENNNPEPVDSGTKGPAVASWATFVDAVTRQVPVGKVADWVRVIGGRAGGVGVLTKI
ncbi:uncharacterized protein SPPG_00900 [Spizellomyces punctatus DAOM BR117]|uniref:Peptide hydrolase n=1 Tax=Spizellomyces punctatus (strain DAOM BR117) TaxID=645134 RepID=A0A0L0HRA9_SPIPD|nr:uncharacterized protein SPPG_00900 [Spizellomyces punctatus DAOM BR117]KND03414.1 hypothetical protein SPPG_00900 [Spizellomyces punctatus DAOM BR117]|eukprot:XP_016611453.1 hypothetical protein SPPG_00900 [Spizellomyces punctatus DAOM BR117]